MTLERPARPDRRFWRRLRRGNRAVPHDEVLRSLIADAARRRERSPAHQAEAALRAGDLATYRAMLNDARANATTYSEDGSPASPPLPSPAPLAQSAIPATAAGQQDLLFTERALTLFLTSHRLGDMRRLIWQYGRNAESVFPKGPYEPDNTSKAGANFGTDVNLPIPSEESNNPLFLKGPAPASTGQRVSADTVPRRGKVWCCFPRPSPRLGALERQRECASQTRRALSDGQITTHPARQIATDREPETGPQAACS